MWPNFWQNASCIISSYSSWHFCSLQLSLNSSQYDDCHGLLGGPSTDLHWKILFPFIKYLIKTKEQFTMTGRNQMLQKNKNQTILTNPVIWWREQLQLWTGRRQDSRGIYIAVTVVLCFVQRSAIVMESAMKNRGIYFKIAWDVYSFHLFCKKKSK